MKSLMFIIYPQPIQIFQKTSKNSDILILFKHTSNDVENGIRDIAGFDMS